MRTIMKTPFLLLMTVLLSNAGFCLEKNEITRSKIKIEIEKKYSDCRIELLEGLEHIDGDFLEKVQQVVLLSEETGFAVFRLYSVGEQIAQTKEVRLHFAAWKTVPMAERRIQPHEHLSSDLFSIHEINVAIPPHRIYRGAFVDPQTDFSKFESKQTLMEGQYPLVSAIEKVPDIRKGMSLMIRLVSNGLTLSTRAAALESGRVGGLIKVQTISSKQEMSGKLLEDGTVEVQL
jgi:flagella basal body P-ring formation protein FlgA